MSNGRVTVVIPTRNRAALLRRAIDSALAQTAADRCDIVVVDDGSTDETPRVAARYIGRIRYVRQPNRGVSAARNTAIRACPNEFTAMLDDDDVWEREKTARQLAAFERWPEAVLVAGQVVEVHTGGHGTGLGGQSSVRQMPAIALDCLTDLAPSLLEANFLTTSSVMVRTAALARIGTFCERLRSAEDHHVWMGLACRGPGVILSAVVARYTAGTPGNFSSHTVRMLARQLQARYLARPALRQRPDCRENWRSGVTRSLTHLRDVCYRQGNFAAAARYGLRALLHDPRRRGRWEWRRFVEAAWRAGFG